MALRPGLQAVRALAQCRPGERAAHGERQPTPAQEAAGQPHPDARPLDARGVLVHVAGGRDDDDGASARQRARDGAVPAVADDEIAGRHRARVGDPVDEPDVGRYRHAGRDLPVR